MRNAKYLVLSFVVLLSLATSASSALTPINIPALGTIIYPMVTVRRHIYQNWRFTPELRATTSDLWIGHWDAVDQAVAAKQIRPDFKAFLYANIKERWANPPSTNDPPGTFETFLNSGWFLKAADGSYVTSTIYGSNTRIVDIGNPAVQQWYADWIKGYLDTYELDGVQLDNCQPNKANFFWATAPSAINPRTGQLWTEAEVTNAIIAFVNTVKNTVGSRYVIGNGIYNGNHFERWNPSYVALLLGTKIDGIISEGWISTWGSADWYSEEMWLKSIDFAVWMEENFLSKGNKIFMTISENAGLHEKPLSDGSYPTILPSGVTKEQYVTYCYASRLLATKYDGNYINFGYYMPEDYPQSLFKIDVGNPLGEYYIVEGTHVYARDFSQVKVLVNPTYDSYSVNLDANYETLDGTKLTSPIIVAPHTGIILKKV